MTATSTKGAMQPARSETPGDIGQSHVHRISQSLCLHTGTSCPALARMVTALTGALDKARPVTTPDFELCGESKLEGCPRTCAARFVASHHRIRVFCDVPPAAETSALDRFADALLVPSQEAFPLVASTLPHRPCALAQVLTKPLDPKQA
ncbi:hypothetical protein [Pseudophaeobacter flagellatus]|uniref:hypothetical protein n=1 Tax=Pseudophaeobacter flagellatus TaxID=2899119 RepID=UPI001E358B12|nr:hypothetical protein [Pseudophaeobacter flagellatus]MCD9148103.1 hypothetical protein [Pseudophaeobacter flagellatus]